MLAYLCEWCGRPKSVRERWILGFAAEKTGTGGVKREISIAAEWSDEFAHHPLAVHFCSEEHKQAYIMALMEQPGRRRAAGKLSAKVGPRPGQRRRRASRRAAVSFSPADEILSRGLGVRLDDGEDRG